MAHALNFDPAGTFQAVCSSAVGWTDEDLNTLRGNFRGGRGTMRCANRGTVVVVVLQQISADELVTAMRRQNPDALIGVGLERQGLAGATASIVDAQEVLPRNNTGDPVGKFQRDWLFATIRPQADRLSVLLGQCRAPAEKHPELAETVRGFAEHGLSLTAAGRALHIHANTVRYRLARWHELTGWDVHTWDGLSASMVGLNLFAQDSRST